MPDIQTRATQKLTLMEPVAGTRGKSGDTAPPTYNTHTAYGIRQDRTGQVADAAGALVQVAWTEILLSLYKPWLNIDATWKVELDDNEYGIVSVRKIAMSTNLPPRVALRLKDG